MNQSTLHAAKGMLYHIVESRRPGLAKRIAKSGRLETMIIGLGGQGAKHAGLMHDFGTAVVAGVAPGKGGSRVHEVIPVYETVHEALQFHPDIVAASVWRHYATAKEAALEAIASGIPLVVLISEGIPLRDVRDIIVAARKQNTLLIGGNTPGLIFPPEKIKIGMLPDVFFPEMLKDGSAGPGGVTIISRSGAILYHMSDAMASVGVAQNAVIGVGGDGAIGATFVDLVPLAMGYEHTDLVVVAGEIGGCQEERLAQDIQEHPDKYPKPIVALISGAHAPEGKTMGHAGAVITPGVETGTFSSKKKALESAGVVVVNSQMDLIQAVTQKLKGKTYFEPEVYYKKMREIWDAPTPKPSWTTLITDVRPNNLVVRGYRLQEIISRASLIQASALIALGDWPDPKTTKKLETLAKEAAKEPVSPSPMAECEDVSKAIARYFLSDRILMDFHPAGKNAEAEKAAHCLGRFLAYLAAIFGQEKRLSRCSMNEPFSHWIYRIVSGEDRFDTKRARVLEAMIVASIDHGVTPPSAQAARIAASVRAAFEVVLAQGVGAITDVHGGAGEKAAQFFKACSGESKSSKMPLGEALMKIMRAYMQEGSRIEGLGHRVHTEDPRRDALWKMADESGISGDCVAASRLVSEIFRKLRGIDLPINVDGVIGAIIADMGLDPKMAKILFIFGRLCGLSAHYFEEIASQTPMRRIRFEEAVYQGEKERSIPESLNLLL